MMDVFSKNTKCTYHLVSPQKATICKKGKKKKKKANSVTECSVYCINPTKIILFHVPSLKRYDRLLVIFSLNHVNAIIHV